MREEEEKIARRSNLKRYKYISNVCNNNNMC